MSEATKNYELTFPSDTEMRVTKVFDAPIELVFKAHSDPKLIPQWWGPRNYTTVIDALDFKPGGKWRFIQKDDQGNEYAFNGTYKEIVEPTRIVQTFEFEGMPGHIIEDAYTFEPQGDKTLFIGYSKFANKEDLDGMVASGMESGMAEGFERLDELLPSLK